MDAFAFEQRRARRRTTRRKRTTTVRRRRRTPLNPLLVYKRGKNGKPTRPRMADKWYLTKAEKIRAGWKPVDVVIRNKDTGKIIAEFTKYVKPKGRKTTFRAYKESRDAGLAMLGRA